MAAFPRHFSILQLAISYKLILLSLRSSFPSPFLQGGRERVKKESTDVTSWAMGYKAPKKSSQWPLLPFAGCSNSKHVFICFFLFVCLLLLLLLRKFFPYMCVKVFWVSISFTWVARILLSFIILAGDFSEVSLRFDKTSSRQDVTAEILSFFCLLQCSTASCSYVQLLIKEKQYCQSWLKINGFVLKIPGSA